MAKTNRLTKAVNTINKLPESMRVFALSKAMGKIIKFAGTSGIRVENLTPNECVI